MKINFFAGLVIIFLLIAIICVALDIYPYRYQYGGKITNIMEVDLFYPDSLREETRDIPVDSTIVFDTWTGTIYGYCDDLNMLMVSNIRTGETKVDFRERPKVNIPEELSATHQENLMKLIHKAEDRKQEDLQKVIIKSILSK